MSGLTEEELARASGSTVEHVRRLADLGILTRRDVDGPFATGDLQRIRLAESLERSGLSLEHIGEAIRSGHLSFAFVDLLFPEPAELSGRTAAELAAELGLSMELLQRLYIGVGLPRPQPETPVRRDDAETITAFLQAVRGLLDDQSVLRAARFFGENLRRLAESEVRLFHASVEEPILRSGMPERQMLELGAQIGGQLRPLVDRVALWLHDRHLEHYIIEDVIAHVDNAVEEAGLTRRREAERPAIVFLDLAGYTRLTEERGDEVAADLALALGELVQDASDRHGGRPVKWLGDGVMFHFADPAAAVTCSLEMAAAAPGARLPQAHVGVNAGPVVFRDGDYYGRTVNLAARIASVARPGEVLVSEDVVAASRPPGVRFDRIDPVELKGFAAPVALFRAVGAAGPG